MLNGAREVSLLVYVPVIRVIYTARPMKPSEAMSRLPWDSGAGQRGPHGFRPRRGGAGRGAAGRPALGRCLRAALRGDPAEEPSGSVASPTAGEPGRGVTRVVRRQEALWVARNGSVRHPQSLRGNAARLLGAGEEEGLAAALENPEVAPGSLPAPHVLRVSNPLLLRAAAVDAAPQRVARVSRDLRPSARSGSQFPSPWTWRPEALGPGGGARLLPRL